MPCLFHDKEKILYSATSDREILYTYIQAISIYTSSESAEYQKIKSRRVESITETLQVLSFILFVKTNMWSNIQHTSNRWPFKDTQRCRCSVDQKICKFAMGHSWNLKQYSHTAFTVGLIFIWNRTLTYDLWLLLLFIS